MPNDFLEKTLEDIIYENRNVIHTRGFMQIKDTAFRQVILPSGRKIDILGFDIKNGGLYCDIYELKRDTINSDAVCQAYNYYLELKHSTKDHFTSFSAQLVMVGRKYEAVPILDALPIPVKVYNYEYRMDGIFFKEMTNPYINYSPNKSFSFGLWAFGYAGLSFNVEKSSISFHTTYEMYAKEKPEFGNQLNSYIAHYKNQQLLPAPKITESLKKEIEYRYIERKTIKTEIFPIQPQWSMEFFKGIPFESIMDDIEFDDGDLEDDLVDNDKSDYEPDIEYEDDSPLLIHEKEYRRSVFISSLQVISQITYKEYLSYFII